MVRLMTAVVLAAVVQFAWGFTYFGVLSGMDHMTTRAPNESAVTQALKAALPETGTYFVPMCPGTKAGEEATKAFEKSHNDGPIVQIHYHKDGISMAQMPLMMGMGFGHSVLTVLLAVYLLRLALPALQTYLVRVGFVFGLGVFAWAATRLGDMIWFHHHWAFVVGEMVYSVTAWFLVGLVIAAILRPAAGQASAAKPEQSPIAA